MIRDVARPATQADRTMVRIDRAHVLLVGIIAVAAGLRLYGLGESFHIDDFQVFAKARLPLTELLPRLLDDSYLEPPLSYLPIKVVLLVGDSEWLLRLPSVISSVIAVFLLYLLGTQLFNRPVGLIAAALLAIAPADIRHAQDLRFWTQLSAVHLASFVLLIYALQRESLRCWVAYALVALVGIYFNVMMVGVLVLQGVIAIALIRIRWHGLWEAGRIPSPRRLTRNVLASQAFVFVGFVPWVITVAVHWLGSERLRLSRGYDLTPDPAFLHETAKWLLTNTTSESILVWILYAAIVFGMIAGLTRGAATPVILGYVLMALAGIAILSDWLGTFLATRRILFLLPLLLLLAAYGVWGFVEATVSFVRSKQFHPLGGLRAVLTGASILLIAGLSVPSVVAFYDSERTNFRGAGEFLQNHVDENDWVVLAPRFSHVLDAELYYMGEDLAERSMTLEEFSGMILADYRTDRSMRVWWVTNFPVQSDRHELFEFNESQVQSPAGARGISEFRVSVFVAREDLSAPISQRTLKLSALAMATAQATTPHPILPGERGMAVSLEARLAKELSRSATSSAPP